MKGKQTLPMVHQFPWAQRAWDAALMKTAEGNEFYASFTDEVVVNMLDVEKPNKRAGIFTHEPNGNLSVEDEPPKFILQLSGVTRNGRTTKKLLNAYRTATELFRKYVASLTPRGVKAAYHVQFVLNGEIEVAPGDYSCLLDFVDEEVEGEADVK